MDVVEALAAGTAQVGAFVVLISILVFVHEWGHYAMGRWMGMSAEVFSVGFGPAIWARTDRRGCDWRVCLLPLGGYVRFRGDMDASSVRGEVVEGGLLGRSPGVRALVIGAGPGINLLFGLVLISAVSWHQGRPVTEPVVGRVEVGSPAATAGLAQGDRIVDVDGRAVASFEDLVAIVAPRPGSSFDVSWVRGDERLSARIEATGHVVSAMGVEQTVGRIGVGPAEGGTFVPIGPGEAVLLGAERVIEMIQGTFLSIAQIATGDRPVSDVGGPVRIAEVSGAAASMGIVPYLALMAAVSIGLGVMNLLPIPVLDGGHLVVCAYEAVTGAKVEERVMGVLAGAGGALLLFVMVGLTASDLAGLSARLLER